MKMLYTAIVILALILTFSITSFITISNTRNEMIDLLDKIEKTTKNEEYETSKSLIQDFIKKWETKESILINITRHETLDIVDAQITGLLPLLENKNLSIFYFVINKIKVYINRIAEEETLSLKNLF